MTDQFRKEWRTIDPRNRLASARHYDNPADARADAGRNPWRVVQRRLVSDWDGDQMTPALPTLADMNEEERRECQWMQADVWPVGRTVITFPDSGHEPATLIDRQGKVIYAGSNTDVTPRPDLPRMEWPDTGQDGEEATKVEYVSVAGGRTAYGPWTVARLRKKPDPAEAPVPPNTLAVGSEWRDADALTRACEETGRDQIVVVDKRGIAGVWDTGLQCWRASAPNVDFAPFTIIHAGKKADQ